MKKKRSLLVHKVVCGVLVAALVVANVAMYLTFDLITKLTSNMGLDLGSEEAQAVQQEASEFTKEITAEGMVLLKNDDDALPLEKGANVNLFGWSSTQMIAGGSGGSGGASGTGIDIRTSLENAGFVVNDDLYNMYVTYKDGRDVVPEPQYGGAGYSPSWGTPEPAIDDAAYYTPELLEKARDFSDVAIFTVGRSSGEGLDLADGYLKLTDAERDVLAYLGKNYETVVLLVNSNSAMELGAIDELGVDAVIFMPGPGSDGADSLGKILCGEINPSGHTVDTFAYDISSAPAYWNANRRGTMEYADQPGWYYVDYEEGIYVGYRYYETAAEEGYIDYDETVQFPFGHGLSYTTFEKRVDSVEGNLGSDAITVNVSVTNMGDVAGKDVVQLYATAPYEDGGIEKASVDLVGFAKSKLLEPGETQQLSIEVDPFEIASYDWNDADGDGRTGYVLEAGDYQIKLMENSHDLIEVAADLSLASDRYFETDPVTGAKIENLFDDVAGADEAEPVTYLSRADFAGTFPTENAEARAASDAVRAAQEVAFEDDADAQPVETGANNGLSVEDLKGADYDDPRWDQLLNQLTLEEMEEVITNGAFETREISSIGQEATAEGDGPQGVNAWMLGVAGVSYPVEMYVGQSWNVELAARQGQFFGREARALGLSGMYAPATNIHRTPYSGRNFEYYAEDGFLSGKLAASVTYAAREEGVFMFVKHFALNDQETYRGEYFTGLCTWSNEQAMREVYLKPFELAVKEGKTTAIMTSFNRVGATWTGASHALMTDLLRDEWGFRGMAITDMYVGSMNNEWWMDGEQGIRAGQDLWLGMWYQPGDLDLDESNPTTQNAMRRAVKNVLYTLSQAEISPATPQADWFYKMALPLDVAVGVGLAAYAAFIVRASRKAKAEKGATTE